MLGRWSFRFSTRHPILKSLALHALHRFVHSVRKVTEAVEKFLVRFQEEHSTRLLVRRKHCFREIRQQDLQKSNNRFFKGSAFGSRNLLEQGCKLVEFGPRQFMPFPDSICCLMESNCFHLK